MGGNRELLAPVIGVVTAEARMPKTMTIILWASPYGSEYASSAARIVKAALQRGHRVHLHATGDGIHAFTAGQGAKGLPNIEAMIRDLIASGLSVDV